MINLTGFRVVSHGGTLLSYRTQFVTLPDMDIGLYTSINGGELSGSATFYHQMNTIYYTTDHLLGLDPWLNETTTCSFPQPWANETRPKPQKAEVPIQLSSVSEYEGSYGNQIFPDLVVNSSAGELRFYSNLAGGIMHPSSEKDRFLTETKYPLEFTAPSNETQFFNVTFTRDGSSGAVTALTFQFEVDFTYFKRGSHVDTPLNPIPIVVG